MNKTLFKNCRFLISKAHPEGVIEHGAVFVDGTIIKAVGATEELERQYGRDETVEILDCADKIVMPGLIDSHNHLTNLHHHLPLAGPSDVDGGIEDELANQVWPAYLWLTDENSYDLILWSLMHSLKHGVTTSANAAPFPDATFRAAEFSKMRLVMHPLMVTSLRLLDNLDEQGYLAQAEEAIRNYHNALDGRVTVGVHASTTWNCTRNLLVKGMELAHKYDVQFATHFFEAPDEVQRMNALWADEGGAFQQLDNIGLLTHRSLFFHACVLTEREIDKLAERGCTIIHNPECNAGAWNRCVAYIPYHLDAGVTVGLGTDGPPRDMFGQMMLVQYLHNVMPRKKAVLEPWVPLELATNGNAKALWLDKQVGTLEPGKRADIITLNLKENTGLYIARKETLFRFMASGAQGAYVTDVMVDGVFLRRDNEFTIFDEEAITARVDERLIQYRNWYEARRKSRGGKLMIDYMHEEFSRL